MNPFIYHWICWLTSLYPVFNISVKYPSTDRSAVYFGCDGSYQALIQQISCYMNDLPCSDQPAWERKFQAGKEKFRRCVDTEGHIAEQAQAHCRTKTPQGCQGDWLHITQRHSQIRPKGSIDAIAGIQLFHRFENFWGHWHSDLFHIRIDSPSTLETDRATFNFNLRNISHCRETRSSGSWRAERWLRTVSVGGLEVTGPWASFTNLILLSVEAFHVLAGATGC